ncbi:MAG UNVERIFIED_CONTAM: hypothetical protein LVT10_00810 [Anaerolineae bacterium]|jgi:hypothetical protein
MQLNQIIRRARLVTQREDMGDEVRQMLNARLDEWLRRTRSPSSQLTYSNKRGAQIKLLNDPQERLADWQIFTCLNSMRDVESTGSPHFGRLSNG